MPGAVLFALKGQTMKINMTGDSRDFLAGLVRDAQTDTGTGGNDQPKGMNGRHRFNSDDEAGADDNDPGPSRDIKEWQAFAKELRRKQAYYRDQRNEERRVRSEIEAKLAAETAKREADLAALRTESENATKAAVAAAQKAADERLMRREIRAALKEAGCKDVDDTLKIFDASGISITDAGDVEGVAEAIDQLKKSKAYLFDGVASSTTSSTATPPAATQGAPKKASEMTAEEYAAARAAFTKTPTRRPY